MRKKTLLIFITMFLCCVCVACIKSEMKKYTMPDGTRLKMSTTDEFYIGFSEETDELILYQDTYEETKIAYTIIDNEVALQYLEKNPFVERGNEDKYSAFIEEREGTYFYYCAPFISENTTEKTEYHYWVYIKYFVENEDEFKRTIEIEDDISRNTISGNLDLYEEE